MANAKHLEILKSGVEKWNKWREENEGTEPDLIYSASGAKLCNADLRNANLRNANLCNANLEAAKMSGTDLYAANLTNADLTNADLTNADLRDANLYDADLDAADLAGAKLVGAKLFGSYMFNARLFNADLTNADLRYANLSHADLSNANLSGARLANADLSGANLNGANLSGADLTGVNLSINEYGFSKRTDLTNVDLTDATLSGANLREAVLQGANLTNAYLEGANLTKTDLRKADLHEANIGYTVFGLVDLSTCRGLESVNVSGPCVIDFPTLRASKNLPKAFLTKLGIPDLLKDYLPDFYSPALMLYPAFLSHSWANKDFARKIYEALIAKGVNVFFDEKKMKPGDTIFESISRGIDFYDKTILVCSKDSLESWWVDQELELVTEKERNLQKETGEKTGLLIPITIDDYIYTWQGGKRMAIRNRVVGDFRNWQDNAVFEKALNDLIHALNVDRPDIKPPTYLKKK